MQFFGSCNDILFVQLVAERGVRANERLLILAKHQSLKFRPALTYWYFLVTNNIQVSTLQFSAFQPKCNHNY